MDRSPPAAPGGIGVAKRHGDDLWTFIFAFLAIAALWVALNTFAWISHWDGYPLT